MLQHMLEHLDIFLCPVCSGDLQITANKIKCLFCRHNYQIKHGIPLFFWPNEWNSSKKDVTDKVKAFYEKTPFPNYDQTDTVGDLVRKAERGIFSRLLNEQVPFNIRILEVGCGTGQSSNFLGIAHRFIFGTDICYNSLKLAQDFKINNNLENVGFYQMNLFRPIFREESFPLVICCGVLHHTSDPFGGFQAISRLVKKGGYIIIGLYNKYGRIATDIRRSAFKVSGGRFKFKDPLLRERDMDNLKKNVWFLDQYSNPHESRHTIREVLRWFKKTGFDFVNSIPKPKPFEIFSEKEKLFKSQLQGNWFQHFLVQSQLLFGGSRENGFFIMIGKRKR